MSTISATTEHEGPFLAEITYNTRADGSELAEGEEGPRTLHGPFATFDEAAEWLEGRCDGDTDVRDDEIIPLNSLDA